MLKQQMYQRFIYKIHSRDILKSKMNLKLTVTQARDRGEIIALADSQVLRFIDEIQNIDRIENKYRFTELKRELNDLKRKTKSFETKKRIAEIYSEIEKIQVVDPYLCVIMDSPNDIDKLQKGFMFNGEKFFRLVGTSNGVKKSTVVYTSLIDKLNERLDNGRDLTKKHVPAKFESYKGLACSASIPLSDPKGVLVVNDLELSFMDNIIELNNDDSDEPIMEEKYAKVNLNASDGFGLMSPELAQTWSDDLKLNYLMSGCCCRNSFIKGMIFTFDFHEFARRYAGSETVIDVWGTEHKINDIHLILTTSMFKLWDSYESYESYHENCIKNGYTFSATKTCPKSLDNESTLNYQFIQSYEFTNDQIHDLIMPTVNEIKSVLHNDVNKSILFLRGMSVTDENYMNELSDDYIKALMIDERMIDDPYVLDKINMMIRKKINDAKIGVVKVKGNYAAISGDPFALCQHIFNIDIPSEKLGLLKAGEIYSKFWSDKETDKVCCFRAPMTCHNNIRVLNIAHNTEIDYWYQYLKTVNILNCHDTTVHACNGADFDGDIFFTTNNEILLTSTKNTPAIICVQHKASKQVVTEDLLVKANKNSFGDEIGTVTNIITAMFDLQARFPKDSAEWQILDYRIKCGQLLQQDVIDRTKGIISKPMPKYWYLRYKIKENDDEQTQMIKTYNNSLAASKKPYFMNYIYPEQKAKYNKFIKKSNISSIFDYRKTVLELKDKASDTEEEDFFKFYNILSPVLDEPSTMNRLCHMVENEFIGYVCNLKTNSEFDYKILKSNSEYSKIIYQKIKKLYKEFNLELSKIRPKNNTKKSKEEYANKIECLREKYKLLCFHICTNKFELCDAILDICYTSNKSKSFAWMICGDVIIENLLKKNDYKLSYLVANPNGEIEYQGKYFTKHFAKLKGKEEQC